MRLHALTLHSKWSCWMQEHTLTWNNKSISYWWKCFTNLLGRCFHLHSISHEQDAIMSFVISTPLEVFAQHVQISSSLQLGQRFFGCVAYVHLHKTQCTKLDPCAVRCVFLSFHPQQKGYRCYHPSTHHMYVSMDVTLSKIKYIFCNDQTTSSSQGEILHENYSWINLPQPMEFSSLGGEIVQPNG